MLVLGRRADESVVIGEDIVVTVLGIEGGLVRLGISAPANVRVLRQEVLQQVRQENRRAARRGGLTADGLATLRGLADRRRLPENAGQADDPSGGRPEAGLS